MEMPVKQTLAASSEKVKLIRKLRWVITSDLLREKKVATVLTCALVDKPSRREVPADPDFVGFTVPDVFIVGYGIDCAREYRQHGVGGRLLFQLFL